MSDYSAPANASLIIPTGYESKYYDSAAVESEGWKYDKDKAVEILEGDLKAKKGSDGIYVLPDGTKLGGWKVDHARPAGPTGTPPARSWPSPPRRSASASRPSSRRPRPWTQKMQNGDFDIVHERLLRRQPGQPVDPVPRRPRRSRACRPSARRAYWNYSRFKNSEVAALVDAAAGAKTDDEAKTAYASLDKIYRENIPCVPLMYRPLEFYEFNTVQLGELPDRGRTRTPRRCGRAPASGGCSRSRASASSSVLMARSEGGGTHNERWRATSGARSAGTWSSSSSALLLNFLLPRLIPGNPVDAHRRPDGPGRWGEWRCGQGHPRALHARSSASTSRCGSSSSSTSATCCRETSARRSRSIRRRSTR